MHQQGQAGVTLLEAMMSIAMMSLVVYVLSNIGSGVKESIARAKNIAAEEAYLSSARTLANKTTTLINRKWLKSNRTLFYDNGDLRKAGTFMPPNGSDVTATSVDVNVRGNRFNNVHRTSNDFELRVIEGDIDAQSSGFLVSRCIDTDQLNDKLTIDEILALPRRPVIRKSKRPNESGVHEMKVACCLFRDGDSVPRCNGGSLTRANSRWRARLYHINSNGVRIFPKKIDRKHVAGVGMVGYFDHATAPKYFNMFTFVVKNYCQSRKDAKLRTTKDCTPSKTRVRTKIVGNVIEREAFRDTFEETGIVELGR